MPDGHKRILSPFAGRKNKKLGIRLEKKSMPVKRRQILAETGRGSYYKEEWLEQFIDSKGAFCNDTESDNDDESCNENNDQQQLREGFASSCHKIVSPFLLQKVIDNFAVCKLQKHCSRTLPLDEDVNHGFGN